MKKTLLSLSLCALIAVPLLACGDLPQASAVKDSGAPVVAHKAPHKGSKLAKAKAPKAALAANTSTQDKL